MLLPLANVALPISPAIARDVQFTLAIPAGPLGDSLAALSAATGISVGYAGDLPRIRTRAIRGRISAAQALARLLEDTGFVVIPIGTNVYRVQRAPVQSVPVRRLPRTPIPTPPTPPPIVPVTPTLIPDIVVTGQKRPQFLGDVPMSISVVAFGDVTDRASLGSRDLALSVDGLALTNLGPGLNRQFIRGVADSPFIGPSQSTVAVQLDDARVTFDAPDPDLRLIDVVRVEILKGPQGPLYGTGALGGIYHIVTRKPVLGRLSGSARLLGESVAHGSVGAGGEGVLNVPIGDTLAVRAVGYSARTGGWIDDLGRRANANVTTNYGGRLALRWQPSTDWTIDLSGATQSTNVADSQYVTASDRTLKRMAGVAEPTDNDFRTIAATIDGRIGGLKIISATSYVDHGIGVTFDASASAALLGVTAPAVFRDDRHYSIFNQELRLSPAGGAWLAGVSLLRATSHSEAMLRDADGAALPVETLDRRVTEYAVFGEATQPLAPRLDAIVGVRVFDTVAEDRALERSGVSADDDGKVIVSPSLTLSWMPRTNSIVYLRYARSLRPGGLAPSGGTIKRYESDELGTLDLGIRHMPDHAGFAYSASLFYTQWTDIQSDYLLPDGLVSTRNAGRARILGVEASIDWAIFARTHLSAGLSAQDGRLTHNETGLRLDDRRLPVTPDITARLSAARDFDIAGWHSSVEMQANYIGRARLTFDPDIDRPMGKYATISVGTSFAKRALTLAFRIDNLLDVRGDSFAFGNPFSIRTTDQYVPLRPRTITLSLGRAF